MKKITRALCVLLALILCMGIMSACHPKGEIALTIGDYEITSGMYACAIVQADMEARNNVYSYLSSQNGFDKTKEIDYLSQTIDGKAYSDWVKDRAINICKEAVYMQMKIAELNLEFDPELMTDYEEYANNNWYSQGQYYLYTANGVAYETYMNHYLNTVKIQQYFLKIYGREGSNPVAEEEVLKKLYDNYDLTYYLVVDYKDSKGNLRKDEDIAADKALFESYAEKINSGELTFKEVEALWKAEEEKRAEEEKKNDTTSSNTTSNTTTSTTTSSEVSSENTSADSTSSGTTSSEEPYSKPADKNAYLIGTSETGNYEFEYFEKVHGLKVGGAIAIEEDDDCCMLFVRGDIKADYYYEKNYYDSALHILKYDSFEADYQKAAHSLEYTENKYATGNFSAKKLNYDDYNTYMKYMQYYGSY